jgi:uncharacterized membrane protein
MRGRNRHEAHRVATALELLFDLTFVISFAVCLGLIYALYYYLVRRFEPFHLTLLGATAAVVGGAVVAAVSGVEMAICLAILTLAPAVTVVGYEVRG